MAVGRGGLWALVFGLWAVALVDRFQDDGVDDHFDSDLILGFWDFGLGLGLGILDFGIGFGLGSFGGCAGRLEHAWMGRSGPHRVGPRRRRC